MILVGGVKMQYKQGKNVIHYKKLIHGLRNRHPRMQEKNESCAAINFAKETLLFLFGCLGLAIPRAKIRTDPNVFFFLFCFF